MRLNKTQIGVLNEKVEILKNNGILNKKIGTLAASIPLKIESIDPHAVIKMGERGITVDDAQSYINNSMIMFEQQNKTTRLYVSNDGNSAVLVVGSMLITAYPSINFDEGMIAIINEVKKYAGK